VIGKKFHTVLYTDHIGPCFRWYRY